MRSFLKAILAILPVALFSTVPALAATESWRQSCSGPDYVCGGAKQASVSPVKKTKPTTAAKTKAKAKVDQANSGDDTPVKPKKMKKKVVASDDDQQAKAKPKKKVAAKAKKQVVAQDDADETPVKAKKAKKVAAKKVKPKVVAEKDEAPAPKKKKAKVAKSDDGGGSSYQSGVASWYGGYFHGRTTANGEKYNMWDYTAAHKTLPFGTRVKVTNTRNGDTVTVRINDRGPFIAGRVIDLSRAAANDIGMANSGVAPVKLTILGKG